MKAYFLLPLKSFSLTYKTYGLQLRTLTVLVCSPKGLATDSSVGLETDQEGMGWGLTR